MNAEEAERDDVRAPAGARRAARARARGDTLAVALHGHLEPLVADAADAGRRERDGRVPRGNGGGLVRAHYALLRRGTRCIDSGRDAHPMRRQRVRTHVAAQVEPDLNHVAH